MATNRMTVIGDCEACDKVQIEVWATKGNILMCATCKAEDETLSAQSVAAQQIQSDMRAVDNKIELKQDVFNASTVAIIQLKGAIFSDDSIQPSEKQFKYTKACAEHFEHMQKVIFDKRQELTTAENEMRAWQIAAQTAAGELTAVEREHFKKLNVSYQPTPIKTIKPKTPKVGTKSYKSNEYRDAAAKYNIPVDAIRFIALQRNLSADDAAKAFVEQIAKTKAAKEAATN